MGTVPTPARAQQRIDARLRAIQALELRLAGTTYLQIAQQLGVSETRAFQYVNNELDRRASEPVAAVRKQELERLHRMRLAIWPKVLRGEDQSINTALKISDRIARLLGLDAPLKFELMKRQMLDDATREMVAAGVPDELQPQVRRELEALLEQYSDPR